MNIDEAVLRLSEEFRQDARMYSQRAKRLLWVHRDECNSASVRADAYRDCAERAALAEERLDLERAAHVDAVSRLMMYVRHLDSCPPHEPGDTAACTCGFYEALDGLTALIPPEKP